MLTREQVKKQFIERGQTVSDWARKNGFRPPQVTRILNGHDAGNYGDAHRIAVLLGLKPVPVQEEDKSKASDQ